MRGLFGILPLLAGPAFALDLQFAQPVTQMANDPAVLDSYLLPTGTFTAVEQPGTSLEGYKTRQSWRVATENASALSLMAPIRDQLESQGYDILWECDTQACGGFDFRFETEVLPAPDMHVDLSDFRFLSATNGPDSHLSLLVSTNQTAGYVQLIRILTTVPDATASVAVAPSSTQLQPVQPLAQTLVDHGSVVLDDLSFETGSSNLSEGSFESLNALADFLRSGVDLRVALVGHTDATGALDRNIALSKRRADSVRAYLINNHGIDPVQIVAEGMGYLSPIATNRTEVGRTANRRVEAILLNTE